MKERRRSIRSKVWIGVTGTNLFEMSQKCRVAVVVVFLFAVVVAEVVVVVVVVVVVI